MEPRDRPCLPAGVGAARNEVEMMEGLRSIRKEAQCGHIRKGEDRLAGQCPGLDLRTKVLEPDERLRVRAEELDRRVRSELDAPGLLGESGPHGRAGGGRRATVAGPTRGGLGFGLRFALSASSGNQRRSSSIAAKRVRVAGRS